MKPFFRAFTSKTEWILWPCASLVKEIRYRKRKIKIKVRLLWSKIKALARIELYLMPRYDQHTGEVSPRWLYRTVREAYPYPSRWWGMAWKEYMCDRKVAMPIPLNLVVAAVRGAFSWVGHKAPWLIEKRIYTTKRIRYEHREFKTTLEKISKLKVIGTSADSLIDFDWAIKEAVYTLQCFDRVRRKAKQ